MSTQPETSPSTAKERVAPAAQATDLSENSDAGLLRNSGSQVIPTLISRITGFLKVVALAATIGLEAAASSFTVANTLPNIIAELVLGAVLTSIVVPVLVRAEREDTDGGKDFTRRLITIAGVVLVVATVVAMATAPWLVRLFIDSDGEVDPRLATLFALLLLPQILFYGLGALFGAILNTHGVFGKVAWAPVLNNVVTLAVIVLYHFTPGDLEVSLTNPKLLVLGIGTTLGIVAQALYLVPSLRRAGVDLRPRWGLDTRLKAFGGMAVAVLAYVLISQAGFIVTNRVASQHDPGGPVLFANAWLLLQVPYGVLGVSLITAIMPRMSRAAAADDTPRVIGDLSLASRLSTVGLLPIIALFTLHGTTLGVALFSLRGTEAAVENASRLGATVAVSAFGLLPFAIGLVQLRVFYARQQPWIPTVLMVCQVLFRIPLMLWIPPGIEDDQVVGWLAFTNGLGFLVGALVGGVLLRRQMGNLETKALLRTILTVGLASAVGVAVDFLVSLVLPLQAVEDSFGALAGALVSMTVHTILILGVAYAVLLVLPLPETEGLVNAICARLPARFVTGVLRRKTPEAQPDPGDATLSEAMLLPPVPTSSLPYPYPVATSQDDPNDGGGAVPDHALHGQRPDQQRASADAPTVATPAARRSVRGPRLVPGAAVAGGRYRLLAEHGEAGTLRFWQARDTVLERDVALTFVDADQSQVGAPRPAATAEEGPQAVLTRTLRLGRLDSPGLARVLDIVRGSSGGIVVAEWTKGRSLADVAATTPPAVGAARSVRALAGATEAAHRAGTVLGLDHPDRIRISTAGNAVLAFPGIPATATRQDDVAGLGAILYALVTDTWPLAAPGAPQHRNDDSIGGLPTAPRRDDGTVPPAREVRDGVPFEISALIERALQPHSGIRSAAAVQTVLDQAAVLDQRTDYMPALDDRTLADYRGEPSPVESPLEYDLPTPAPSAAPRTNRPRGAVAAPTRRQARSRKLVAALVALAVVALVIVAYLANLAVSAFSGSDAPLPSLSLPGVSSSATPSAVAPPPAPSATPPSSAPVQPTAVSVFSPQGTADNAGGAARVIDGNPATQWTSDQYLQQFPALKQGLGLLVTLPEAGRLTSVAIDSPSAGTVVEIRSATSATPTLAGTRVLSTATLQAGRTDVALQNAPATQHVLVWITRLGGSGASLSTKISEITFQKSG
ncbi:lipid II flippase MurJ [Rhodococcus sp. X156]|uniref:lipid II flippase MurJ n=1 Tax=Rhodococcus sp. X156 TaxID=2499145 RepID=UPI0013E3B157|nr:lipid II flippase MurJ [Rhodococcus sp. X156]